jgi:uncharacterized membrane protein YgdD (TMEM256/DUF423 family)
MHRVWIALGSLAGLTAVAMAALAAHGLEWLEPARLQMVRNGVEMHGWHALALLACGIWAERRGGWLVHAAGFAFVLGILGFCGGLYALALSDLRLPGVPPTGGVLLMLGWLLLAASALRRSG